MERAAFFPLHTEIHFHPHELVMPRLSTVSSFTIVSLRTPASPRLNDGGSFAIDARSEQKEETDDQGDQIVQPCAYPGCLAPFGNLR